MKRVALALILVFWTLLLAQSPRPAQAAVVRDFVLGQSVQGRPIDVTRPAST